MKTKVYAHYDLDCHFTIVPYSVITNKTKVELRACIISNSTENKEVSIDYYLDEYDTGKFIKGSGLINLKPGEKCFFHTFLDTGSLSGDHNLMAAFTAGGMPIGAEYIPIKIVPCETMCLPFIQTAWIEPGWYASNTETTADDARKYMHTLKSIGINGIIIVCTESIYTGFGPYFNSSLPDFKEYKGLHFDYVDAVLSECEKLNMNVFVGLGRGDDLWLLWTGLHNKERIDKQLDFGKRLANELLDKYGSYKSFYGWFIAHETDTIEYANAYYNPMSDILHSICPDKPVMIAPSPGCIIPSEDCQDANRIISEGHYDIVAYQDSVGAGARPFGYTFNQEVRIANLHKYYKRNLASHANTDKHIWTDMEIWCMDGPEYDNSYAALWSQTARQIEIERNYVEHISAYAMPGCMQDRNARLIFDKHDRYELSLQLFDDYKAYFEKARGVYGL